MQKVWFLLTVLVFLLAGGMVAAEDTSALDVTQYTLDNGLEVILVKDASAPTVATNILFHVGGAYDPAGRSGFAHLFEHLMFEESAHLKTGDIDRLIEQVGGFTNAYTSTERTVYYIPVPAHQLPLALWIEADRLASLVVSEENFENQRSVVIEEYQQRVGNAPYGEVFEDLWTLPYTYEPYRQRIIGSIADLNAAKIDDVINFHSTYYVPNNATLVVAGDIDVEATRALVEQFFGPIPAGAEPPALPAFTPAEPAAQRLTVTDPLANVPAILFGYPIPARTDADFAALEVAARLLGTGDSSRLAQALLDTGLSVDAGAFTDGQKNQSAFVGYAFANVDVSLEQLEQVYLDELNRLVTEGVTAEELEKTINQIRSERIVSLETVEDLAENVQTANFYFGDPQAIFTEIDAFAQVTAEDVQRVIQQYLTPERATVWLVQTGEATPEPEATAENAAVIEATPEAAPAATAAPAFVIEQATPPESLPVRELVLPEITEKKLDNGLTVIVIPRPEVPIIAVELFFPGGESAVSAEQAGLSEMTAGVLTRGTENRSAQELASAIEQVGGSLSADATQDRLSVGAFALREDADLAFELLSDVVLNPTFPEEEVEVYRQQMLTNLQSTFSDPEALAARTFNRLAYGEHPYGNTPTETTINALTPEIVREYYAAQANPQSAFMIVTGAVTADEAVALAENAFGGWAAPSASEPLTLSRPEAAVTPGIYLVDRPGSTQATYTIGHLSLPGSDSYRYAAQVTNAVFGGTFGARLSRVVREELGYTYGIYSSFTSPVSRGTFSINTSTGNDVAAPALQAILDQIKLLRDEPVPTEELEAVKSGLIGQEALRMETYQSVVNLIASLRLRGLDASELAERTQRWATVDQAGVQTAAQDLIVPEELIIVVVGDASVLEAPLSAIAPVTVIEAE